MMDFRQHEKYQNGVFKTKSEIEDYLKNKGYEKIYYVLSFGGGTQSTHLLEEHFRGNIYYDFICFSDTGAEPDFIHEQVAWWKDRQKEVGNNTPFIITHHNSMHGGLEEMLHRYIETDYQRFQMPVFCNTIDEETEEEVHAGMMPRQCTVDFKIIPVKQTIRRRILKEHGLGPRQRFPKNTAIIQDIGFSVDEINRVSTWKSPQYKYIYMAYPLIEQGLTTPDSINFLKENGFPEKRSRCYFCPFNCDNRDIGMDWYEIIEDEPESFLKAVYFDDKIREVQATGTKNMRSIPYLHHTRIPLRDAYPTETKQVSMKYQEEFNKWLTRWKSFIKDKYV